MDLWQEKSSAQIMEDLKKFVDMGLQNKTCLHHSWILLGSKKQLDEDQTVGLSCMRCGALVFANSLVVKEHIK